MGVFNAIGKIFGVDDMSAAPLGEHQGGYGNNLGLRPELVGIGESFREHKAAVERCLGEIVDPPILSDADIDALALANAEEAAMHERVKIFQDINGQRIARTTTEFETKMGAVEEQEKAAHGLQGRMLKHVDALATNAVKGSIGEHALAGRLAGLNSQSDSVEDLVRLTGL